MNTTEKPKDHASAFVQGMVGLCMQSKGARAALRRSLSPEQESGSWIYLSPWIDLTDTKKRKIHVLIAGMLASEKTVGAGLLSLGKALRLAVKDRKKNEGAKNQFPDDPRFRRLLATDDIDDVLLVLRPIIQFIQSRCPGQLDYSSVLRDLEFYGERVRARWAQEFFRGIDNVEEV